MEYNEGIMNIRRKNEANPDNPPQSGSNNRGHGVAINLDDCGEKVIGMEVWTQS